MEGDAGERLAAEVEGANPPPPAQSDTGKDIVARVVAVNQHSHLEGVVSDQISVAKYRPTHGFLKGAATGWNRQHGLRREAKGYHGVFLRGRERNGEEITRRPGSPFRRRSPGRPNPAIDLPRLSIGAPLSTYTGARIASIPPAVASHTYGDDTVSSYSTKWTPENRVLVEK